MSGKQLVEEKKTEIKETKTEIVERVIVRAYPKSTVLVWWLAWASLIFAILNYVFSGDIQVAYLLGLAYVLILLFLLFITSFEFTRGKTISLFLLIAVIVLAVMLLGRGGHINLGVLRDWILSLEIYLSWQAYLVISLGCFFILFIIWFSRRFDYWIFEPNQIIHKQEPLGETTRYPAANVRFKTEIRDIFEYLLFFGSGALIVHIPSAGRSFEFSLVPRIRKIDQKLSKMYSYIEVK